MALDYSVFKVKNNEILFKAKFYECEGNGQVTDFGTKFPTKLTPDELKFGKEIIPLHKIVSINVNSHVGSLTFFDKFNIKKYIQFTYRTMLNSTSQKKLEDFTNKVLTAKTAFMKTPAGKEIIKPAPPDTCYICGSFGGVPIVFKRVISFFKFSIFNDEKAVYCRRHIKSRGLYNNIMINSLFGWWSISGIIMTPYLLFKNAHEIGKKSDLHYFLSIFYALLGFWPFALVLYIIPKFRDYFQEN